MKEIEKECGAFIPLQRVSYAKIFRVVLTESLHQRYGLYLPGMTLLVTLAVKEYFAFCDNIAKT